MKTAPLGKNSKGVAKKNYPALASGNRFVNAESLTVRPRKWVIYRIPIAPKVFIGEASFCTVFVLIKVMLAEIGARFVRLVEDGHFGMWIDVIEDDFVIGIAGTTIDAALGHGLRPPSADSITRRSAHLPARLHRQFS